MSRELAMLWWNYLEKEYKETLSVKFYERPWNTLTGREIELIWNEIEN